ncbi:4-hydroxy-tetrahydrodipicolinate reductase [Cochleicola gelatinilyticus]|uniref:4-hydroxy-tetrahydrodipicolinate reductase n=1 Tax=Cochleicola gelatinilyticus TaxID=1763537 RepID=A0A167K7Q9_9FLAO|nr:4-hydroxy-tetrahydrodipicolinate reductase [Cochleicola gelatinilyticus]OAB81475.1 4-hydroxy-tetrahydrodipicolinate reductase [Cochleicola gelatinilyticus]
MKIALLGYGKMGKTIEALAIQKGHTVVYKSTSTTSEGILSEANVAIEFSSPDIAIKNIAKSFEAGVPVVCGTTGWLDRYEEILKLCEQRNGSFLYASNFSVGVNLFFKLNAYAASLFEDWKEYMPAIEEVHHTQKKDAPSGTAITLAEGVLKHRNETDWVLDKQQKDKVTIKAQRIDDVKGTHTVTYASDIDTVSLKHEAHSRDGFALGAILAAEWLQNKEGVFTMEDVLFRSNS